MRQHQGDYIETLRVRNKLIVTILAIVVLIIGYNLLNPSTFKYKIKFESGSTRTMMLCHDYKKEENQIKCWVDGKLKYEVEVGKNLSIEYL